MRPPLVTKTIIIEEHISNSKKSSSLTETHIFEDKDEYLGVIDDPANLWVLHGIDKEFIEALKKPENRTRYQDFVYGYLYYYDMVLKDKVNPHALYFKWDNINYNSVEIFISPKPNHVDTSSDSKEDKKQGGGKEGNHGTKNLAPVPSIDPKPPPKPPPPEANA